MLIAFNHEPSAELCNRLVRGVAERDRNAFRGLYRQTVHHVFRRVCADLGSTPSAVAVTKSVFVEVWRLAPVLTGRHDDVIGWMSDITERRVLEQVAAGTSQPPVVGYDECINTELTAALKPGAAAG